MKTRKALSAHLDKQLNNYVAAAGANADTRRTLAATAMSAIALGSLSGSLSVPANAELVYTPANHSVGCSRKCFSSLKVDLNNDGIPDFTLFASNNYSFSSGSRIVHSLWASGQSSAILQRNELALANAAGQIIGGPANNALVQFKRSGLMAESRHGCSGFGSCFKSSAGLWFGVTNRYLGIKFSIDGEAHYGWARLNASAGHATLTGYAYETEPNKPIPAGVFPTPVPESNAAPQKPATLGVLALGAVRSTD